MVLPAVLQPLQYPEGLLIRAQDLSVDLAGVSSQEHLPDCFCMKHHLCTDMQSLLLTDATQLSSRLSAQQKRMLDMAGF